MYKSYTYLLHHKPTNTWYYGVRWKNVRLELNPEQDLWKEYFTSSKQISLLRTLFGDESFEFEIRKTFDSAKKARDWEEKVLVRMKVLQKPDQWINRRSAGAILYEIHPRLGKPASQSQKDKQRQKMMGKPATKTSFKKGFIPHNAGRKPTSEEYLKILEMTKIEVKFLGIKV